MEVFNDASLTSDPTGDAFICIPAALPSSLNIPEQDTKEEGGKDAREGGETKLVNFPRKFDFEQGASGI